MEWFVQMILLNFPLKILSELLLMLLALVLLIAAAADWLG